MGRIEAVAAAYAAAVYAKDVDALLSLYAPDVFAFDMWGQWSYDGRDELAGMFREWLGSLGDERVQVDFTPEFSRSGDDWAIWCATVRYAGLAATGEELRYLENRCTWSLRREGGEWLIVHEHSSAPADFKSLKVSLRRG